VLLALSCAPTSTFSGRSNSVQAAVDAEQGRVLVRPNEVAWTMGEAVSFEHTIDPDEIGRFSANGSVMAGPDTPPLPGAVQLAASREVLERAADGMIVTHHIQTRTARDALSVRVWGRLLHLDDLGPMSEERADLRRIIDELEASAGTGAPAPQGLRAFPRPAPARPSVSVAAPSSNSGQVRTGVQVGSVTGLVVDMADRSPVIDATSVRLGVAVGVIDGVASFDVPTLAYQVEFIDGFLLQPTLGLSGAISLYAFSSAYPTVQGIVGVEVDPEGAFEAQVGLRSGVAIGAGGAAFTPDLAVGWVW